MTWAMFSPESSCLATCNCRPLHVSVHILFALYLYNLSKKLVFEPVANTTAGVHRDCPLQACNAQWPERYSLLCLEVKLFPLTLRYRWTDREMDIKYHSDNQLKIIAGKFGSFGECPHNHQINILQYFLLVYTVFPWNSVALKMLQIPANSSQ